MDLGLNPPLSLFWPAQRSTSPSHSLRRRPLLDERPNCDAPRPAPAPLLFTDALTHRSASSSTLRRRREYHVTCTASIPRPPPHLRAQSDRPRMPRTSRSFASALVLPSPRHAATPGQSTIAVAMAVLQHRSSLAKKWIRSPCAHRLRALENVRNLERSEALGKISRRREKICHRRTATGDL